MGYPTVNESGSGAASEPVTITLPAYSTGDLLIIAIHTSGSGTHSWAFDHTLTALYDGLSGSSQGRTSCKYRVMEAGDTDTTIVVDCQFTTQGGWTVIRFAAGNWNAASNPVCASLVQVNNTNSADPPSISPAWGAAQNTYLVIVGRGSSSMSAAPDGYTATTNRQNGTQAGIQAMYKQATSSTEDPGTLSFAANVYGDANTLAVRGTAPTWAFGHITT